MNQSINQSTHISLDLRGCIINIKYLMFMRCANIIILHTSTLLCTDKIAHCSRSLRCCCRSLCLVRACWGLLFITVVWHKYLVPYIVPMLHYTIGTVTWYPEKDRSSKSNRQQQATQHQKMNVAFTIKISSR